MKQKIVSTIMQTLLTMNMLTLTFSIQPVGASGTIYIRPDGTVEGTDKIQRDGDVYTFTDHIYDEIVVERDNIVVDGAGYTLQGDGIEYSVGISVSGTQYPTYVERSNITIKNVEINSFYYGIYFFLSFENTVAENNITHNVLNVVLSSCTDSSISGNNITNSDIGVVLAETNDNIISGNEIADNSIGIADSSYCTGNFIFRNNITKNVEGIQLGSHVYSIIRQNTITDNSWGIRYFDEVGSCGSTISENTIMNNYYGIEVSGIPSSGAHVYNNNFVNNTVQAVVPIESFYNTWDDGYPSGGNYWSDYSGVDFYRGPYQNETGIDGIGDTPYIIDEYNQDNYPLMHPYGSIRNLDTSLTYLTIQSAIDAPETLDSHTIFVESGTYHEHVVLNKTVSLVGQNRETTIIDGDNVGNGVEVTADNATVVGFTISNSWSGIYVVGSTGITIDHNHLANNNGIFFDMSWCGDKTISGNTITNSYSGISIWSSSNIAISGNSIIDNLVGVRMVEAFEITISGNNITNNRRGISLTVSDSNIFLNNLTGNECAIDVGTYSVASIYHNNLSSNEHGVLLGGNHVRGLIKGNTIINNSIGINQAYEEVVDCASFVFENIITENNIGINLPYCFGTSSFIYHNNFVNNTIHAYGSDYSEADNVLDDGYPSGGNYWSSYIGVDLYRGPHQNETGSDGIVDVPYMMDVNTIDFYPLMKPYGGQYDIGIVSLNCSKNVVGQGYNLTITVKVINYGIHDETFNVIVYANTSIIETRSTVLASRNSTAVTFDWNTTGFAYGNYTISVAADTVPGETDIADNIFIDGTVSVTIWGDVDGDGDVDGFDLTRICGAYGSTPGDPDWDETCDIDGNGIIDGFDLTPACGNYGENISASSSGPISNNWRYLESTKRYLCLQLAF